MFRLQLHPTPVGLFFGIATVAFWALLWLVLFVQLQGGFRPAAAGEELVPANADPVLAVAFDFR